MLKDYGPHAACLFVGIVLGSVFGPHKVDTKIIEKPTIVKQDAEQKVQTKIVYVQKEAGEKTDIQASIGKPDVTVNVNGHEAVFTKADDEQFVFEKGKLQLDQSSKISLDLQIQPTVIDTTKHHAISLEAGFYGFGLGYRQDKWHGFIYSGFDRSINAAVGYDLIQW